MRKHLSRLFMTAFVGVTYSATVLATGVPNAMQRVDETPQLMGCAVYSANTTQRPVGLYTFSSSGGEFTQRLKGLNTSGGGVLTPETYWGLMYSNPAPGVHSVTLLKVDPSTWRRSSGGSSNNPGLVATDMAYDPTTDNIYGCFQNDDASGYVFGYADFNLKRRFSISTLEKPWSAVAASPNGQIYAIDSEGILLKVDKRTGTTERIGATGTATYYPTSAVIDPATGKLWWTVSLESRKSSLYEVNLTTGKAVKAFDFECNEQYRGLGSLSTLYASGVPDAAKDLKAVFPEGALQGKVTFTAPTLSCGGAALSESIRCALIVNGIETTDIQASPGETVTIPVSMAGHGDAKLTVVCSNNDGTGKAASVRTFIGEGCPKTPAPKIEYADGAFKVSWPAVTAATDGGYFNSSEVRYRVVRKPDNKVVAESTSGISLTDSVAESDRLSLWQYTVTATFRSRTSASGMTPVYMMGNTVCPEWEYDFSNKDVNALFSTYDANGDGATWFQLSSTSGGMGCSGTKTEARMDDWLFSPPVRLEGGNLYRFHVRASAGYASKCSERFGVYMGNASSVDAMSIPVIPDTVLTHSDNRDYSAFVKVDESALYRIGIHGCSDPGSFRLDIGSVKFDAPISLKAPAAPEILSVMPATNGSPAATFSFRVPDKAIDGLKLESVSKVECFRDGVMIKEFTNPAPGTTLSFEDAVESASLHSYSIVASNTFGAGMPSEQKVFMGINIPSKPIDVNVHETDIPGEVTVTWKAPDTDKDGNPINPQLITYRVVRLSSQGQTTVADNLKETSFTYMALAEGNVQEFAAYGVIAVTKGGESAGTASETICIGVPYSAPFRESFPMAQVEHTLGIKRIIGNAQWKLATSSSFTDVPPQDNDGGFIAMQGQNVTDSAMIYTGKIDLRNVKSPALTFWTYNITDSVDSEKVDINTLDIMVDDGQGWKSCMLSTVHEAAGGLAGWRRVVVPLPSYSGKVVQFAIAGCIRLYAFIMIDNLRLGNMEADNLSVVSVNAPETASPGQPLEIDVTIENSGLNSSGTAELQLYRNGIMIGSRSIDTLTPGAKLIYTLPDTLNVVSDPLTTYKAEIIWENDADKSDNTALSSPVTLRYAPLPSPTDLSASMSDGNVYLSWNAPDAGATTPVTEDFESYPSYTNTGVGDWTFVDADQGEIGAIQGIPIPGIEQGSKQSFWVMDADIREDNPSFRAHSGKKYLAQMYVSKNGGAIRCDDWAISPLLSGAAQTISLYARTYNRKYPESFKIMYSTSGKGLSDFKEVASYTEISDEWTEYTAQLPAGARYFAVRAVSYDCMMFLVDDITYQPAASEGLSLEGYNVWRDGEKINTTPVKALSFVDSDLPEGTYGYRISALWNEGESAPTETATVLLSGIRVVSENGWNVSASDGILCVEGAEGSIVEIYDLAGRCLSRQQCHETLRYPLNQGIYIVRVGHESMKVTIP